MFKFFRRSRLVKQGMASGKIRRRISHNTLIRRLEEGRPARALLIATFATLLLAIYPGDGGGSPAEIFPVILLLLAASITHLRIDHPEAFSLNSRLLLILGIYWTHLAMARVAIALTPALGPDFADIAFLAVPFAFAPLTLSVLLGPRVATHAAIYTSLWTALLPLSSDLRLFALSITGGFVTVAATARVRRRSTLVRAALAASILPALLAILLDQIGRPLPLDIAHLPWPLLGKQILLATATGVLTATIVGGILPMLEGIFRVTTDISWLEAADLNHPLLTEMSLKAPGTYYHSMAVAQLAEAAAEAIGANGAICRVCSYFHDIGKLIKPQYFVENILLGPRQRANPHDEITSTMSCLIIKAHVKDGVDLAIRHRLNPTIIDVINQHHGTTVVTFFYSRGRMQQEDVLRGSKIMKMRAEDPQETSPEHYRYDGPKPQFKESAIVSLADSVESAARSISKPNSTRLDVIIQSILNARIADGQLEDCGLTLAEIREIGDSFRSTIQKMMHGRVPYGVDPDADEPEEREPRPSTPSQRPAPPPSAA